MNIFERIYNSANNLRLFEIAAETAYKNRIAPELKNTKLGKPLNISNAGVVLNRYNEIPIFTDINGNEITQSQFVINLYNLGINDGYEPQKVKDAIFYYLYPANKKFIIPENWSYVEKKKRTYDGKEITVKINLTRHTSLDMVITEIISAYLDNYKIVEMTDKNNKLIFEIKKNNKVLDEVKDKEILNQLKSQEK